jgi:very-short-patch-repair endonuclease
MENFKSIKELSRELRKKQTKEEGIVWEWLKNRRMGNCKFLRQYPTVYRVMNGKPSFFIADFYCAEKKLVIELDGKIHDFQKEYDLIRENTIKEKGLKVLRIKNEELKNALAVKDKILKSLFT